MNPIISSDETLKKETKDNFENTFEHLIKYHSLSNKHELEQIFEIWYSVFNSKIRIYSTLSAHFFYLKPYGMSEAGEDVQIFLRNITLLKEIAIEKAVDDLDSFSAFVEKIRDHIELIGVQINRMDSGVEQIEKYKLELSNDIQEMKRDFEKTKSEFEGISSKINKLAVRQEKSLQKAKKVQKEFVTILGIFATILITTFGGLTSLASIFNNIKSASTGKLMLMGSFVIFTVLLIVFLLLNGISKLSELNIRSCGCDVNSKCNCSIARKHPTLYIITTILLLTAVLGASDYIIDYNMVFNNAQDSHLIFGLTIILISISFFSFIYFIIAKK